MHQPELRPFESSYHRYTVHPFTRPPEMQGEAPRHAVAIVGAGPIGLVLAVQLALHGTRCVLIEAEAQVSGGSRALAMVRRTMEIMEQCGVAEQFLEGALLWDQGRSYYRNHVVHELVLPFEPDDKFGMTNLAQCAIEDHLVARAVALGVDIRWQTRVTAMQAGDDGVRLSLDTPEGPYELQADWLVACDGARSTVRKLQGLRFEGQSFESRFVIADFHIKLDEPPGRRCYFDPPWLPGHSVLMHEAPADIWRLDYQVPHDVSDEEALDRTRIAAQIDAHLQYIGCPRPWEFEWVTLYKPNTLTLARYRHGRVLYCGDAAHLLPVFGVRGMNTGVQDSINLGWKLAAVAQGRSPVSLLDTYSDERVADARHICVEAGRSTRMMAPPTRGYRTMQLAVLSLAQEHEFVRGLLHWRTSHPIDYAASPLSVVDASEPRFQGGPRPGAPARNVQVGIDGREGHLLDAFGPAFHVLVFGDDAALWAAAARDVAALREEGRAVRLIAVRREGPKPAEADALALDADGRARERWGAAAMKGAVYVLRPDQHVASRWDDTSALQVREVVLHQLDPASHVQVREGKTS